MATATLTQDNLPGFYYNGQLQHAAYYVLSAPLSSQDGTHSTLNAICILQPNSNGIMSEQGELAGMVVAVACDASLNVTDWTVLGAIDNITSSSPFWTALGYTPQ